LAELQLNNRAGSNLPYKEHRMDYSLITKLIEKALETGGELPHLITAIPFLDYVKCMSEGEETVFFRMD
jgi:hypothetical protein